MQLTESPRETETEFRRKAFLRLCEAGFTPFWNAGKGRVQFRKNQNNFDAHHLDDMPELAHSADALSVLGFDEFLTILK